MADTGVFTQEELDVLIRAALENATEDEVVKFVKWAELVRIGSIILDKILEGNTVVSVREDGELRFVGKGIVPGKTG